MGSRDVPHTWACWACGWVVVGFVCAWAAGVLGFQVTIGCVCVAGSVPRGSSWWYCSVYSCATHGVHTLVHYILRNPHCCECEPCGGRAHPALQHWCLWSARVSYCLVVCLLALVVALSDCLVVGCLARRAVRPLSVERFAVRNRILFGNRPAECGRMRCTSGGRDATLDVRGPGSPVTSAWPMLSRAISLHACDHT